MNKFVKAAHMLFACLWLGAAASATVLQCLRGWSDDGRVLAALNLDLGLLGLTLIIPGAVGSSLTGFLLCHSTGWHIMRYRWVTAKWIGALFGVLAVSMLLIPMQIRLVNLSGALASAPVTGGEYDALRLPFAVISFLQVYLLMTMMAVAVLKPWGERLPHPAESRRARPAIQAAGLQRRQPAAQGRLASGPRS